jgi:16S rRNA (adenine1518-N6/adenine1519-N6)-dimethyltransferase
VIRAAELDGSEIVTEVGPGFGQLTRSLAARCHELHAFELDGKLVRYLRQALLPTAPNVVLRDAAFGSDALQHVAAKAQAERRPLKIVSNLPYQISSAFLHSVVDYAEALTLVVVMLQREVAQRVVAGVGDPGYNSFSLYLQTFLSTRWVCDVPVEAFLPPPQVAGAVVAITPLVAGQQPRPQDRGLYLKLVEGTFRHRRKQLANAVRLTLPQLGKVAALGALTAAGIDPSARPEELSMGGFVRLADALSEALEASSDAR